MSSSRDFVLGNCLRVRCCRLEGLIQFVQRWVTCRVDGSDVLDLGPGSLGTFVQLRGCCLRFCGRVVGGVCGLSRSGTVGGLPGELRFRCTKFGCGSRRLFLPGTVLLGARGFLLTLLGLLVGCFGFGAGGERACPPPSG
ncbi:hypothetical protein EGJ34_18150 [Stenotrophomonas sp. 278]|nr:hypothetical protein EGJ34_18150 [Stenotrophomonas sp. 278]